MARLHGSAFRRRGRVPDTAGAAAVSHVAAILNCVLAHDGFVHIGVVNDRPVHVNHCGVIGEGVSAPHAAHKSDAHVAEPVVHTAVVADLRSPVTRIEHILTSGPSPVRRCPERAFKRCGRPFAGNPVIAIVAPGPVAGRPHPSCLRAERLFIDREHRRRDCDCDGNSAKTRSRNQSEQKREQNAARRAKETHCRTSMAFRSACGERSHGRSDSGDLSAEPRSVLRVSDYPRWKRACPNKLHTK